MRRYYLETYRQVGFPIDNYERKLILNSPTEEISVSEDVDKPFIEFCVGLDNEPSWKRPKNSEFRKYKEISEEDYINYLSVSLDYLKTLKCKNDEVYIVQNSHSMYDLALFSDKPKNKYYLSIEIQYSLDSIYLMIFYDHRHNRRNSYRENGTLISPDSFNYLLLKTLDYIADDKNYTANAKSLIKDFNLSYDDKLYPVLPSNETVSMLPLVLSLKNQVRQLEFRLMQNDSDKKGTREKLRGKIEGLKTAINEINKFSREIEKRE